MTDIMKDIANTFKCANATGANPTCKNDFQDERYGKGVRVFTPLNSNGVKSSGKTKCCTVCEATAK